MALPFFPIFQVNVFSNNLLLTLLSTQLCGEKNMIGKGKKDLFETYSLLRSLGITSMLF